MAPPPLRYLSVDDVWAINVAILSQEGQSALLRNRGALDSALMRPRNVAHYQRADVVMQAAVLIAAVALAHAFLDGNKRTALIAGIVFLDLNGFTTDFAPSDDALGRDIEALVADHAQEDAAIQRFCDWLRPHVVRAP